MLLEVSLKYAVDNNYLTPLILCGAGRIQEHENLMRVTRIGVEATLRPHRLLWTAYKLRTGALQFYGISNRCSQRDGQYSCGKIM